MSYLIVIITVGSVIANEQNEFETSFFAIIPSLVEKDISICGEIKPTV